MADVELNNITKTFGYTTALKKVSFEIEDAEFFVLLGPTGAGKTTTLRVIAGLEVQDTGSVLFDGHSIDEMTPADRDTANVFGPVDRGDGHAKGLLVVNDGWRLAFGEEERASCCSIDLGFLGTIIVAVIFCLSLLGILLHVVGGVRCSDFTIHWFFFSNLVAFASSGRGHGGLLLQL